MGQEIQERQSKSVAKGFCKQPTVWKIVGGTALTLAIVGLILNLPDIKRYIRISTM